MPKAPITLPDKTNYNLKRDRFRQERGGTSKIYEIFCTACTKNIFIYQKDGPGSLKRCYLDRIAWPSDLANLQNIQDKEKIEPLHCRNCNALIGTLMVYEPEGRLAYRLIPGAFGKRNYKSPFSIS